MTDVHAARLRHHLHQLGHHHDAAHAAAHAARDAHLRPPANPQGSVSAVTPEGQAPRDR